MPTGDPCSCGMGMLGSCFRCSAFTGPYAVRPQPKQGWVCPKCDMVMAPWMPNCTNCKPSEDKKGSE